MENIPKVGMLCNAWALIADPAHWCQFDTWLDDAGLDVPFEEAERTTRYSADGALIACWDTYDDYWRAEWALDCCAKALYGVSSVVGVNIALGHAAVERCYALAVAAAHLGVEL